MRRHNENESENDTRKPRRKEYQARYYRRNRDAAILLDQILEQCNQLEESSRFEGVLTEEEVEGIEQEGMFEPVDYEKKRYIFQQARQKLLAVAASKLVCAVFDCSWPRKSMHRVKPCGKKLKRGA